LQVLADLSVQGIVDYIQSGKASKIVTLAGAGISTSAGIPDFRSPDTGLYSNLQKYKLADPHAIFEIGYFRTNPQPFFKVSKLVF
jgi:NAD-dependent deacetylase sirtuin 2